MRVAATADGLWRRVAASGEGPQGGGRRLALTLLTMS